MTLLLSLIYQLVYPNVSYALTTGPSQPEVMSFEPVGTTDMVDMFTGDFNYNIPLLDVEGYPVNIAYHGGIGMEQEASWVGLGWNINPGVINRAMRGVPDDFKGDSLKKQFHIKDEKNLRVNMGITGELFGAGDPLIGLSAQIGGALNFSNYRGVSADFSFGAGVSLFKCVSAGVNVGVGSQTGAEIDYNAGIQLSTSQMMSTDISGGIGVSYGQGYSTRSGLKDASFSISSSLTAKNVSVNGPTVSGTIPISLKNYVPVITNSSTMNSYYGRIKLGLEAAWCNVDGYIGAMKSIVHHNNDGSRRAYGYLYSQDASPTYADILDFSRDRDGMFNKTMQYLPPGNMTYDVYAVSGQGTGGVFRPFRNDQGSVYDPTVESTQFSASAQAEASIAWLFAAGGDGSESNTRIKSGPWTQYLYPFTKNTKGSLYENTYFKQGGELTQVESNGRDPRANFVNYFTAEEASKYGVASSQRLYSYDSVFGNGPIKAIDSISRFATSGDYSRKKYHISEVVQTQTDGRRYVYGIAAMNNVTREATFSTDAAPSSKGLIYIDPNDDSPSNQKGLDNYYSATITPSYAHSYLLTSVLSLDYVDVTGDGPSDDDLGSFTKFNYTLKNKDYRWKAPIQKDSAQYNPGYLSDKQDDKANYVIGSREQWILQSIESKNFIAEFYVSTRKDGKGVKDGIKGAAGYMNAISNSGNSYKLDSIKLYNKHDRFINQSQAVPVKTVYFDYDYSLCRGLPTESTIDTSMGKLTLKKIAVKYGNSDKSIMSPYKFEYNDNGILNPRYAYVNKDRWGNYKPSDTILSNFEYPFVSQDSLTNEYAKVWSLKKITLPSGGTIEVDYESDDYAFVQDRLAMDMFKVEGVGNGPNHQYQQTLYNNKNSPNLYVYFKRRINDELNLSSFKDKYLKGADCIYYNFNIDLYDGNYEQVKGYAGIDNAGVCTDDPQYGYVKLKAAYPSQGNATMHPAAYTGLNIGRYNLPNIFFPGMDPDRSGIENILAGLKQSFDELFSMGKNPIIRFLEKGRAKYINTSKSFIRLNDPGLKKKGGGQRVKTLIFNDSWAAQAGGNSIDAHYGKNYDYTLEEPGFGKVSSGVASYEPIIGGDENPFRVPVKFTVQNGSKWPPNDPVDLYQETPVAESFLPPASVGYRKVTVTSIHKNEARSAQGIDVYEYCTAKDFPFIIQANTLNKLKDEHDFGIFNQRNTLEVNQSYTITLNDMHGKPLSVKHFVDKAGNLELINSQIYEYYATGKRLNNNVKVLARTSGNKMQQTTKLLGVESDLTIDTREKTENTDNANFNFNCNVTNILAVVVPIVLPFPWEGHYKNEFRSMVATTMVQQYGILKSVKTFNEGATTILTNEVFDPITGIPLITSVNNEFNDLEYNVNYPAYWGTKGMGPAYRNTGFEETVDSIMIKSDFNAYLMTAHKEGYQIGDELLISYNGQSVNGWVMGLSWNTGRKGCCDYVIKPRFPNNTQGWTANTTLYNVDIKVVRSGYKNHLTENMQSYTTMKLPFDGAQNLKDTLSDLIFISAKNFSDTAVNIPTQDNPQTLNEFAKGQRGVFRLAEEYEYVKKRDYWNMGVRRTGLFSAISAWLNISNYQTSCSNEVCNQTDATLSYMKFSPYSDGWFSDRKVTAWNPYGMEVENKNAVAIYSTATYGHNEELPTAIAQNSRQGEVLSEGFEDYKLLLLAGNLMQFFSSPFHTVTFTGVQNLGSSKYRTINLTSGNNTISTTYSHSGLYSLKTGATPLSIAIPVSGNSQTATSLYNGFTLKRADAAGTKRKYLLSYWVRPSSVSGTETAYTLATSSASVTYGTSSYTAQNKSNLIDRWQKIECVFETDNAVSSLNFIFPANAYIDDIRVHPYHANMKAFVYHPFNEKLMATLDENNFATFYEYDQEGNLVRTKKETEKGIMTISESRSAHPNNQ